MSERISEQELESLKENARDAMENDERMICHPATFFRLIDELDALRAQAAKGDLLDELEKRHWGLITCCDGDSPKCWWRAEWADQYMGNAAESPAAAIAAALADKKGGEG